MDRPLGGYKALLKEQEDERRLSKIKGQKKAAEGWEAIQTNKAVYEKPQRRVDEEETLLKRLVSPTLLGIFLIFVTTELLEAIWNAGLLVNRWVYQKPTPTGSTAKRIRLNPRIINGGKFSLKLIYMWLAVSIRLFGTQNNPMENTVNGRPIRENIKLEAAYFDSKYEDKHITAPNIGYLEFLTANFLITNEFFPIISKNFQSLIHRLGCFVAGDEKLLHYTGHAGFVRLIMSKPDRIGL